MEKREESRGKREEKHRSLGPSLLCGYLRDEADGHPLSASSSGSTHAMNVIACEPGTQNVRAMDVKSKISGVKCGL